MIFDDAASILLDMQAENTWYDTTTGSFDIQQYLKEMMDDHVDNELYDAMLLHDDGEEGYCTEDDVDHHQKKKRQKRIILARRNEDGQLEEIPPTESLWWHMYVDCPQQDDARFLRKFRRRFRLPYKEFLWFVDEARKEMWFPEGKDATGKPSSPLELLILGAFRYLGRGLTFDDLEESTAISEEVHRKFFHKFIEIGSTILYERFVKAPQTKEEVEQHMHEFAAAGAPGAFASTDATNIVHELCNWKNRRAHIGFKSKHACRTYNMTVNHRRRILATTSGNPGSFNDKTLILFDTFIRDIKRGDKLDDYTFELLERRGEKIVSVKYKGVWIVVDNGYHNWSTTVPPISNCVKTEDIRWSAWIESMRKDVGTFTFCVLSLFDALHCMLY